MIDTFINVLSDNFQNTEEDIKFLLDNEYMFSPQLANAGEIFIVKKQFTYESEIKYSGDIIYDHRLIRKRTK